MNRARDYVLVNYYPKEKVLWITNTAFVPVIIKKENGDRTDELIVRGLHRTSIDDVLEEPKLHIRWAGKKGRLG